MSLVPVAGKGPNDLVFVATYSPASRFGNSVARNADPAVAILDALDGEPDKELVKPIVRKPQDRALEAVADVFREPWDN